MDCVKRKLNTTRGATFLLALLLLMVSTMVSVVIVTAATSALKRVRAENDGTQQALALQSGAKLLRSEIVRYRYEVVEKGYTQEWDEFVNQETEKTLKKDETVISGTTGLDGWMQKIYTALESASALTGDTFSVSMKKDGTEIENAAAYGKFYIGHLADEDETVLIAELSSKVGAPRDSAKIYLIFKLKVQRDSPVKDDSIIGIPEDAEGKTRKTTYRLEYVRTAVELEEYEGCING